MNLTHVLKLSCRNALMFLYSYVFILLCRYTDRVIQKPSYRAKI